MKKIIVSFILITALFAAFVHSQTIVSSQTDLPLNFIQISNVLEFVKKGKKTIQEVIEDVKKQKVNFPLTAENEKQLRNAGATDKLIEAIRQNSPSINNSGEPTAGIIRKNSIEMELVYIPPGKFMMGSTKEEIDQAFAGCKKQDSRCDRITFEYESGQHEVIIKNGFWMGKYEVTQGQWQEVMHENPSALKGCGLNCPVNHVSWEDIQHFLTELNKKNDGFEYSLPSEAEWEYAARAGTTTAFAFGESINSTQVNFDPRKPSIPSKNAKEAKAVGSYIPNAFGLYDMHGNVWEWCQDIYSSYKSTPRDGSADMTGSSGRHVARGGAWDQYDVNVRSATRNPIDPLNIKETDWFTIGFRVVAREKTVQSTK